LWFVRISRIHWTRESGRNNNRFLKAFDLVPHDRLLTKITATRVDMRVVVWVKEFFLGCSQRIKVDGQPYEEVRVNSRVP